MLIEQALVLALKSTFSDRWKRVWVWVLDGGLEQMEVVSRYVRVMGGRSSLQRGFYSAETTADGVGKCGCGRQMWHKRIIAGSI